MRTNVKTLKL